MQPENKSQIAFKGPHNLHTTKLHIPHPHIIADMSESLTWQDISQVKQTLTLCKEEFHDSFCL